MDQKNKVEISRLGSLNVHLEPWRFENDLIELRVVIETGSGERVGYKKAMPASDFKAIFDIVWDQAKRELDREIEKITKPGQVLM